MTEQEVEALTSILNHKELTIGDVTEGFQGISPENLESHDIKSILSISIVPKLEDSKISFQFVDLTMKSQVTMRALPPIELTLALTSSYPSASPPLLLQCTSFYNT